MPVAISPEPGQNQPEPEAKIGAMGRVIGAFTSPKATFEDIARKPSWVLPMLILILGSLALNSVLASRVDWPTFTQQNIGKNKFAAQRIESLPADQRDQAMAQQAMIAKYSRYGRGVLGFPLLALIGTVVYMLAFNLVGGANIRFSTAFALGAFAHLPLFLHDLLGILITVLKDPSTINPENVVASNIGAILGSNAPLWQLALGANIDVFNIWCWILVAMAFTAANPRKLTFGKSLGIVIGVTALLTMIGVGIAAAFS
jgi:hypothetical protein